MTEEQKIINIDLKQLVNKVAEMHKEGYRLVQIGCTKLEGLELNYSFDKDYHFVNLRLTIPSTDIEIPSVSKIYLNAFLYENELHDLFGINVKDMAIDYKGNFYRLAVKQPFNPKTEA